MSPFKAVLFVPAIFVDHVVACSGRRTVPDLALLRSLLVVVAGLPMLDGLVCGVLTALPAWAEAALAVAARAILGVEIPDLRAQRQEQSYNQDLGYLAR